MRLRILLFSIAWLLVIFGIIYLFAIPKLVNTYVHFWKFKPFSEVQNAYGDITADTNHVILGLRSDGVVIWRMATTNDSKSK